MSYTTIPGETTANSVGAAPAPTPSRRKQAVRGLLFAAAGVLVALGVVTAHDNYAARNQPSFGVAPYAMPPLSRRANPRAALMREASMRFGPAPLVAPAPELVSPQALRAHPRAALMRQAGLRFGPRADAVPTFARNGAPRPFVHPALYERAAVPPMRAGMPPMRPPMREAMPPMRPPMREAVPPMHPAMQPGFVAPPRTFFAPAPVGRAFVPFRHMAAEHAQPPVDARAPVGAPHFMPRF